LILLPSDLWDYREKYDIAVNESMYDDPLWQNPERNFYDTHPLITADVISQLENRYGEMQKKGLPVSFFLPLFRLKNLREKISEGKILAMRA